MAIYDVFYSDSLPHTTSKNINRAVSPVIHRKTVSGERPTNLKSISIKSELKKGESNSFINRNNSSITPSNNNANISTNSTSNSPSTNNSVSSNSSIHRNNNSDLSQNRNKSSTTSSSNNPSSNSSGHTTNSSIHSTSSDPSTKAKAIYNALLSAYERMMSNLADLESKSAQFSKEQLLLAHQIISFIQRVMFFFQK